MPWSNSLRNNEKVMVMVWRCGDLRRLAGGNHVAGSCSTPSSLSLSPFLNNLAFPLMRREFIYLSLSLSLARSPLTSQAWFNLSPLIYSLERRLYTKQKLFICDDYVMYRKGCVTDYSLLTDWPSSLFELINTGFSLVLPFIAENWVQED